MKKTPLPKPAIYARGGVGMLALIGIVIGALTLSIGFTAGYMYFRSTTPAQKELAERQQAGEYEDTFADGWAAARQHLVETGFVMDDIRILSGTVTAVGDTSITLTTELINPLDDESLKRRTVVVDNTTEIVRQFFSDPGTLDMESQEEVIALQDLSVGTIVDVQTSQDVAGKQEFTAEKIVARGEESFSPTSSATGDVPPPPEPDENDTGAGDVPPPPPPEPEDGTNNANDVPPPPPPSDEPTGDANDVPPPPGEESSQSEPEDVAPTDTQTSTQTTDTPPPPPGDSGEATDTPPPPPEG